MHKLLSSFASLNITQFLTALNDNLYKLLLVFFLISLKGEEHSNTILSLAGAIFVIPFLLFASVAGTLADRYSKRSIIYFTRMTEILTTLIGLLAFTLHSAVLGYSVLFLMATHSALFSPCKYGILPEIVPKHLLSHCNGMITATTYLAIILGTFLASFLTEVTSKNFVLSGSICVLIALFGFIFCLGIEKTKPQARSKKVSAHFISTIIKSLIQAKKRRYLVTTLIFGAYFLFVGSYTQLNIIPFTLQSLHLTEVQGGYLFLMTAIGIGLGSFFAGRLSGKEVELGFVPLSVLGIMVCLIGLYFFQHHFYVVVPLLTLVGLFGGFFIVPVDAFIQIASPDKNRGQNVATGNFLSFIGVILASGLLALLGTGFKLSAAFGFFIVGLITCVMAVLLFLLFADQVLRLFISTWARLFLKIRVLGRQKVVTKKAVLLIAPRSSWLDTIIVMATLPRLIRYIVPMPKRYSYSLLYRMISLIPIDIQHFSPIASPALEAIRKELATGNSVCLMHPIDFPAKTLSAWEEQLKNTVLPTGVPILPIHISRAPEVDTSGWLKQLLSLRKGLIKISYGSFSH